MIESIKSCSYDKKPSSGKPVEDVAEFEGDDPYDDLRYAVDSAERYFMESKNEFERIQKQEELVNKLNQSGDWTGFYRNSARLESSSRSVQVVRRFHRIH